MAKAEALCWNCKHSRYYDELHIECANPKAHFSNPLIHRQSRVECEFYTPRKEGGISHEQ